jgi:hypothetical protein
MRSDAPEDPRQDVAVTHDWLRDLQDRLRIPLPLVREVLERILPLAFAQAQRAEEKRERLLELLLADLDVLDPVPHASVWQAQQVAETRNRLLASGAWSIEALAEARGTERSSIRTWLARHRTADRLISVAVRGEVHVPALLLDEAADPYEGIERVLRPLREAGMDPWAVWVWLDSPSSWLDGERPADLLPHGRVEAVARAAHLQASGAPRDTSHSRVA